MRTIASVLGICAGVAAATSLGGAMEQKQVETQLSQNTPINCATAPGDLRVVQNEKANVAQRIAEIQQTCGIQ